MNTLNRRNVLSAGAAGILGLVGVSRAEAACAHCADCDCPADFEKAAGVEGNFKKLAELARIGKRAAERRAENFTRLAAAYRDNGLRQRTRAQAQDAARALEHVAEHQRDVAQALEHLIETYEGLAEPYTG